MGEGGGGEEKGGSFSPSALSLFRFHLSPFPPETPDTQAIPYETKMAARTVASPAGVFRRARISSPKNACGGGYPYRWALDPDYLTKNGSPPTPSLASLLHIPFTENGILSDINIRILHQISALVIFKQGKVKEAFEESTTHKLSIRISHKVRLSVILWNVKSIALWKLG